MSDPLPSPGPSLCHCFAARQAARASSQIYDRHLAPAGLTINQFSILVFLHNEGPLPVSALAERMVMERTSLVRALKPLERDGLVGQARHGRRLSLSLTAPGLTRLKEAAPLWRAAQAEFEDRIGRERARRLREDLLHATQIAAERTTP